MTYLNKLILDSVEKTITCEFKWLENTYRNKTSMDDAIITLHKRAIESLLANMRKELEGEYE